MEYSGRNITEHLIKILYEKKIHEFSTSVDRQIARHIKEKLCHVALDFKEELRSFDSLEEKSYTLPCGKKITVKMSEIFTISEALFRPDFLGIEAESPHDTIYKSIASVDPCIRRDFYPNIVLAGGTTLMPGFAERLKMELVSYVGSKYKVSVNAPESRENYAWEGASVLSSLPSFGDLWISSAEYDECGKSVVHKKCF